MLVKGASSSACGLHAEVQMGKEVATEVSRSGLRCSLGRIAIPAAYFSWGLTGWEGSFRDHWPTVSTKRRERPRGVPKDSSTGWLSSFPEFPISCGRPLKSCFWQMGTGWHHPSHVRNRELVQIGKAREEEGALMTLVQPSAGSSHCQPTRLHPTLASHSTPPRISAMPLSRRPCQLLLILKSQCPGSCLDWSHPVLPQLLPEQASSP